jgi:hypothetical protein
LSITGRRQYGKRLGKKKFMQLLGQSFSVFDIDLSQGEIHGTAPFSEMFKESIHDHIINPYPAESTSRINN